MRQAPCPRGEAHCPLQKDAGGARGAGRCGGPSSGGHEGGPPGAGHHPGPSGHLHAACCPAPSLSPACCPATSPATHAAAYHLAGACPTAAVRHPAATHPHSHCGAIGGYQVAGNSSPACYLVATCGLVSSPPVGLGGCPVVPTVATASCPWSQAGTLSSQAARLGCHPPLTCPPCGP